MKAEEKTTSFLTPESILEGPFWPERIKAVSYKQIGTGIEVKGIGAKSERFYSRILRKSDLEKVKIIDLGKKDFSGYARAFFLSMEGNNRIP